MALPVDRDEASAATDRPVTEAVFVPDTAGLAGHPRGLTTLFFTEMWERFSYYGMRAILILFMVASPAAGGLGFTTERAAAIYGLYTGSVYFTAIPGGWIADRLLGLRRAVLVGGILIALGHYCLAANVRPLFYAGLVFIVLGTGLLKPNISSIVGQLYTRDDPRRDAGFSLFYMGINLGALISPLVCGYLGQKVGWHWGFGAAGVGMTLGLVQYVLGKKRLGRAGELAEAPAGAGRQWALLAGAIAAASVLLYLVWPYRDWVMLVLTAVLFAWLLRTGARSTTERKRIGAIIVLFVFATLFWIGFEQAGSSLNLFADQYTRNVMFGWSFPSSWYQSVEPVFVVGFAPVFAWLWLRLGRHEPSSPAKFAYGLLLLGLGFLFVAVAAQLYARGQGKVSPWWLILLYLFHALGELSLSPVGLSTVTKLAPARIVGLMMGVWFLALSLGNFLAGHVAGMFEKMPLPRLFGAVFLTTTLSAVVLAVLTPPIKRLMAGVH
ncbi:MAG: MFS transporter [Acidobacteria bacterium]|nr:MAG: MFS transporter [Acidobacteriota bacterium]